MKTVRLNYKYKNLNDGEFAGFEDEEADYLLSREVVKKDDAKGKGVATKLATLARNLRLTKFLGQEELAKLLPLKAPTWEDKEEGQCIVLVDSEAQVLLKAGAAEEMVPVRYRKLVKIDEFNHFQPGHVAHVPATQAKKLAAEGIARPIG